MGNYRGIILPVVFEKDKLCPCENGIVRTGGWRISVEKSFRLLALHQDLLAGKQQTARSIYTGPSVEAVLTGCPRRRSSAKGWGV